MRAATICERPPGRRHRRRDAESANDDHNAPTRATPHLAVHVHGVAELPFLCVRPTIDEQAVAIDPGTVDALGDEELESDGLRAIARALRRGNDADKVNLVHSSSVRCPRARVCHTDSRGERSCGRPLSGRLRARALGPLSDRRGQAHEQRAGAHRREADRVVSEQAADYDAAANSRRGDLESEPAPRYVRPGLRAAR